MARGQIRILLVEPTETGAGSIIDALRQQGCAPIHQRVENKAGLLDALKHQTWDAVIANYLLPGFSGLDALIFVRHISASLPFIMISGIYGEATAVEAMKAGASDYLLRADLGRLGTVLENELAAAESRRHRQRAEGAMQFLASIVDSSEDAIYGKDLNCIISSWNPAAERIYGYRTEDIIGKSITLLFPKHRRDELLQILTAVRGGRAITFADTERRHQDGRLIPISVIISPIRNGEGRVVGRRPSPVTSPGRSTLTANASASSKASPSRSAKSVSSPACCPSAPPAKTSATTTATGRRLNPTSASIRMPSFPTASVLIASRSMSRSLSLPTEYFRRPPACPDLRNATCLPLTIA